jgi:DUF971 family protein
VNRRDLYAAVDSYVEVRVSRAEAEVTRLRSEMADLRRRAEEQRVLDQADADVTIDEVRRVVRGYASQAHRRERRPSLSERIARALLARMAS